MRGDAGRVAIICVGVVLAVAAGPRGDATEGPAPVRLPVTIGSQSRPDGDGGVTVEVERGDHLWKISERRLGGVTGRKPEDTEITPYWRQVIEVNREGLLSGDPDLIYPGEMVTLPPSDSR
jgi:nucleoid-associated protein YgaU